MKAFLRGLGSRMMQATVAVVACALLVFSAASPAVAFGSSSSSPSEGMATMNDVQATSKQAVKGEPRGLKEVQRKAQEGPNEVQGKAGMDAMNTPGNSQEATSVRDQIGDALDQATSDR